MIAATRRMHRIEGLGWAGQKEKTILQTYEVDAGGRLKWEGGKNRRDEPEDFGREKGKARGFNLDGRIGGTTSTGNMEV